jgi:hypothetical protein
MVFGNNFGGKHDKVRHREVFFPGSNRIMNYLDGKEAILLGSRWLLASQRTYLSHMKELLKYDFIF